MKNTPQYGRAQAGNSIYFAAQWTPPRPPSRKDPAAYQATLAQRALNEPEGPRVLIVPRKEAAGADGYQFGPEAGPLGVRPTNAKGAVISYPLDTLRSALLSPRSDEGLFTLATVPWDRTKSGQPTGHRINKNGARRLFSFAADYGAPGKPERPKGVPENIGEIHIPLFIADFDNVGHAKWDNPDRAWRFGDELAKVMAQTPFLDGFDWYVTPGGFRMVQGFDRPIIARSMADLEEHNARMRGYSARINAEIAEAFAAVFGDAREFDGVEFGREVDPSGNTWNHLFRVPRCRRDGKDINLPLSVYRQSRSDEFRATAPLYDPGESPAERAEAALRAEKRRDEQKRHREAVAKNPFARVGLGKSRKDWSSVDLVKFFSDRGDLRDMIGDGKFVVVCPWQGDHSTGEPGDGSTVIFTDEGRHRFHCRHAHCAARDNRILLKEFRSEFEAACTEEWFAPAKKTADAERDAERIHNFASLEVPPPRPSRSLADAAGSRSAKVVATASVALIEEPPNDDDDGVNSFCNGIRRWGFGIQPKESVMEETYVIKPSIADSLAACGNIQCGFRMVRRLNGRFAGTTTKAPYACKKMALCNECAQYISEQRANTFVRVDELNPEKKWAAAMWKVIAEKPDEALKLAMEHASKIIKIFTKAGVPAARWIQINKSRFAKGTTCVLPLQFMFEMPRPGGEVNPKTGRTVAQELWHQIAQYEIPGVIRHADNTTRYAIHLPSKLIGQFVWTCSGWSAPWAADRYVLGLVLPVLHNIKLFLGNHAMNALLKQAKDSIEPEFELVHHGLDLDALDTKHRSVMQKFLALNGFIDKNEKYKQRTDAAQRGEQLKSTASELLERFTLLTGDTAPPRPAAPPPRTVNLDSTSAFLERVRLNVMVMADDLPGEKQLPGVESTSDRQDDGENPAAAVKRYIPCVCYRSGRVVDISEAYAMRDALRKAVVEFLFDGSALSCTHAERHAGGVLRKRVKKH